MPVGVGGGRSERIPVDSLVKISAFPLTIAESSYPQSKLRVVVVIQLQLPVLRDLFETCLRHVGAQNFFNPDGAAEENRYSLPQAVRPKLRSEDLH